ncbi:MAG: metalloregulator ArsR/SmtB family transcription factor [Alphaproteobacteria bacterium]
MDGRDDQALNLDATLAALADPVRRQAVELLRQRPRRASELARLIGLPRPAMSKHLRVLRLSRLVEESSPDSDARVRVYELRQERFAALADWLAEVGALWTDQLAAFRDHVERDGKARK